MKVCAACNAENPDSANFCRKCGTSFAKDAQPEPAAAPEPTTEPTAEGRDVQDQADRQQPQKFQQPASAGASPVPVMAQPQPIAAQTAPIQVQPAPAGQAFAGQQPQSAPQPQPAQVPTQGAMPGAVPGMAPAQQTGPSQFKLFFDWVLAALKKPSLRMATPTWWACVPMFVEAAIVSLLVTIWAAKAASAVLYPAESILSMMGESSRSISVSSSDYFSLFFRGFIGVALVLYALVLIVFLGRKIFGDADTFRQVHDTFAQIVIPFAVFHLALVLLSLVGASVVAGVLFFLSLAFMALLPSYLVAISANHRKLDSFWLWLFAMIAVFFILVLLMIIFSNIAGSAFMGALSRWN